MSNLGQAHQIHFVGLGGIGLSAIARILAARGYRITGSDLSASSVTSALEEEGIPVHIGHHPENVGDADLVVISSAVLEPHVETEAARRRGIPVIKRDVLLGELTHEFTTIAVAGTHGKTTTTAMITLILAEGGLDPTAVIGGIVPELGTNARIGGGEYLVLEADEYDRTFLALHPTIGVITSMEFDHPDIFKSQADYRSAFESFAGLAPKEGTLILNGDEPDVRALGSAAAAAPLYYGLETGDWRARDLTLNAQGGYDFKVMDRDKLAGSLSLVVPGKHMAANALAASLVGQRVGVPFESIAHTLHAYIGAERRFQIKAQVGGVTVVDDYAHHPTEIRVTLQAARERFPGRPLWAVFQPHTFSRTRALLVDFASSLQAADHILVLEVYPSRECDEGYVNSADLVRQVQASDVRLALGPEDAAQGIVDRIEADAVLITLGAGDVNRVGAMVTAGLSAK